MQAGAGAPSIRHALANLAFLSRIQVLRVPAQDAGAGELRLVRSACFGRGL